MFPKLREQIKQIAVKHFNEAFAEHTNFPIMVHYLGAKAFFDRWDHESIDARAVRRANELLEKPGWISDDEPGILDEDQLPDTMISIDGRSYRCTCGANVFKKISANKYRCNGCQTRFYGEE